MNRLMLLICLMYATYGYSQIDTMKIDRKLKPIISMEIAPYSGIYYTEPKSSKGRRSLEYYSTSIFSAYLPVYRNFGLTPILGYHYNYYYDKHITGDKYQSKEIYFGIGLEKRFRVNEKSNVALGIQRIFNEGKYTTNTSTVTERYYYSNAWRFRVTGNTRLYKRIGITTSLNFVAYPRSSPSFDSYLGSYRDINFSFGFTYNFKRK